MSQTTMIVVASLAALALVLAGLALYTDVRVRRAEARYPPAGSFVAVDDVRLHYVAAGSGAPVVMIHGDGGSTYDWTLSVFDRVAERYQAVAVDRPGLGYSGRPAAAGGSPFVQADLIRRALASLDVERPVLLGHSRGGNVALAYALAYPDEIAGVVTLAAAPYGGRIAPHNRALTVPIVGPLLAHTVYVPFGRGAVEAGLETAFAPEGPAPAAYVDVYAAYELRPEQLLAHAHDQVQGRAAISEMAPRYEELRVPLVIVHGTADRNVPIEQARRLHRAAPDARLMEVEGAGHELMFVHPEVVMEAIAEARRGGSSRR